MEAELLLQGAEIVVMIVEVRLRKLVVSILGIVL